MHHLTEFLSTVQEYRESYAVAFANDVAMGNGQPSSSITEYVHGKELGGQTDQNSVSISQEVTFGAIKKAVLRESIPLILHTHTPYHAYTKEERARMGLYEQVGFSVQDWIFMNSVATVYAKLSAGQKGYPICFAVLDGVYYQGVCWLGNGYGELMLPDLPLIYNPSVSEEVVYHESCV